VAVGGGGVSVTPAGAGTTDVVVSLCEAVRVALNTAVAPEAKSIRSGKVIDDLSISSLPAVKQSLNSFRLSKLSLKVASWSTF
jgi:hypothetical protein